MVAQNTDLARVITEVKAGAASDFAVLKEQHGSAAGASRRTLFALVERLGRPFIARYGAIEGQEAVKVRLTPLVAVVATDAAPQGVLVYEAPWPEEKTLPLARVRALEEQTKLLGLPALAVAKPTEEFDSWWFDHREEIAAACGEEIR